MRPSLLWRKRRPFHVAIVTIAMTVSASALVLTGAVTDTQAAQSAALQAQVKPSRLTVNHLVTVTGTAPSSESGHRAVLETALTSQGRWSMLTSAPITPAGTFRFRTRLRHSGYLRVVSSQPMASAASVSPALGAAPKTSANLPVVVHAHFGLRPRTVAVLPGRPTVYSGRLMPARAGRRVSLQARVPGGWRTVGSAHTGRTGVFRMHATAPGPQSRRLRVVFSGDQVNAQSIQPAGQMMVFSADVASWYDDGGNTACGYHAGLGVANRTLPCGTKVRFYYGGRTVTATVDDRGPYVGGRDWDLNQNTAAALGFGGVGTVWVAR
jgi:rare lipoprotein A